MSGRPASNQTSLGLLVAPYGASVFGIRTRPAETGAECHVLSSRSGMPGVAVRQANAGITSWTNSSMDRFCSFRPRLA